MDDPLNMARLQLLKILISGLGNIGVTLFQRWLTWRTDRQKELSSEEPSTTSTRVNTQLEAVDRLLAQGASVEGAIEFDDVGLISQSIRFQAERRLQNTETIVGMAAENLDGKDAPDHEPDHEFTARFFTEGQDVSTPELQVLWAKVLAGEVERPGSTSIKTLGILKNMDTRVASIFSLFASACLYHTGDGRVPNLGGRAGNNVLQPFGFPYRTLNLLNEHGLIVSDYESWRDLRSALGLQIGEMDQYAQVPFYFQGQHWVLNPTGSFRRLGKEFRLTGVALTSSGMELSKVVQLHPMNDYKSALLNHFAGQHLRMVSVEGPDPRTVPLSR